jgi:hypothetical protein
MHMDMHIHGMLLMVSPDVASACVKHVRVLFQELAQYL